MNSLLPAVVALTRAWTAFYTSGLPGSVREERRTEIDCDLWEQQQLARLQHDTDIATARAILLRFLTGMPADCAWRAETGAMVRSEKRNTIMVTDSRITRLKGSRTFRIALIVGLAILVFGQGLPSVLFLAYNVLFNDGSIWLVVLASSIMLAPLLVVAGLYLATRKPAAGIALVTVTCLAFVAAWFWMFFLTIPISIGLIALSVYLARRSPWRSSPQPA